MPSILAQKDLRRAADLSDLEACSRDTGGLSVPPVSFLYEARPLAFKPPSGFLPSLRCHAADLAIWVLYNILMPAYEHLNSFQSGRFIRVHRGFHGVTHDEVNIKELGVHWVGDDNAGKADQFATQDWEANKGTVLVGLVHKRHLMDSESEEHEEIRNYGEGAVESEREIPLRPGTPVHLVHAYDYRSDGTELDREFNPRRRGRV